MVSQSTLERSRELQIRRVFGADPGRLFVGELTRSGRVIVTSAAVGIGGAVAVLRVLASSFRGFADAAAMPTALSTLVLVTLALVATAVPAWRAVHGGGLDGR